ncbi:acyl-CoA N-acyltransferase [Ampelomyces quisqualis]|uniref:Acyl-CoA N-acyltransferase n=1 Tax=Ampelomyces quisqualis TaxID=50730 RepID=A0A6A5QZF1_AMPQU|nr:acyl-CoA N-acyltransferase [Ampelomyces quisqualis]
MATSAQSAAKEAQIEAPTLSEDAPIPEPIVTTARLGLRPYHLQDVTSMALNADNPAIAKYMSLAFPSPYTLESAKTWIIMNPPSPHVCQFGIYELSSPGTVIGSIGLKLGADVNSHTAEIGYWIGERYCGKGYTTEALGAMTKWAFESYEGKDGQRMRRLWGGVFAGNVASMRCFEKCGYPHEGVMKGHAEKHGEVMDMHVFGLTKADWEARK